MRISDQEFNRLKVLKTLRRAEPICRTDLAKLSALTGGTITEISGKLVKRALVLEEKETSGRRGRPRVHLRLNPTGAYALGAYIASDSHLHCEVVDLKGASQFRVAKRMRDCTTIQDFADQIARLLTDTVAESPFEKADIQRVGLGLPAVIDSRQGVIHWLQTFDSPPFPAARIIQDALGIPVTIDNNINVLARAEHWFGEGEGLDNFTLLNLGLGISASGYANGVLMTGAHGLNSEIGHSKIMVEGGRPCSCGASGCLDAYCSTFALLHQICQVTGDPLPSWGEAFDALDAAALAAKEGDERLRAIFAQAGRYLGVAIASHINALDPGRVMIMVKCADLPALLLPSFTEALDANCLPPFRRLTAIDFTVYDEDLYRKGAAALVLEQIYSAD